MYLANEFGWWDLLGMTGTNLKFREIWIQLYLMHYGYF